MVADERELRCLRSSDRLSLASGRPPLADTEAKLYDLGVLRSVLDEVVELAVADARAEGVTWAKIGDALGVTHQAVIKRYRKAVVADA